MSHSDYGGLVFELLHLYRQLGLWGIVWRVALLGLFLYTLAVLGFCM